MLSTYKPDYTERAVADALPCPFCGAAPVIHGWHGGTPLTRIIACKAEGCPVGDLAVIAPTEAEALAKWNTRASLPVARRASDTPPAAFVEYIETNYPSGVRITNPTWHAPKLWRAAVRAMEVAP